MYSTCTVTCILSTGTSNDELKGVKALYCIPKYDTPSDASGFGN